MHINLYKCRWAKANLCWTVALYACCTRERVVASVWIKAPKLHRLQRDHGRTACLFKEIGEVDSVVRLCIKLAIATFNASFTAA